MLPSQADLDSWRREFESNPNNHLARIRLARAVIRNRPTEDWFREAMDLLCLDAEIKKTAEYKKTLADALFLAHRFGAAYQLYGELVASSESTDTILLESYAAMEQIAHEKKNAILAGRNSLGESPDRMYIC